MQKLLDRYHDDGKEPPAMAKDMEWFRIKIKLQKFIHGDLYKTIILQFTVFIAKKFRKYVVGFRFLQKYFTAVYADSLF